MKCFNKNYIILLDFGSQYTPLIARRVRELGVYCKIVTWNITKNQIRELDPRGIILSGSPESVIESDSPRVSQYIFEAGIPILGICYGMHIMVIQLGGQVKTSSKCEFGYAQVKIKAESELTNGIKDSITEDNEPLLNVWMSHKDTVTVIPPDFSVIASTEACTFSIIANKKKHFYGLQFHPEVTHTQQGMRILECFLYKICKCKPFWIPEKIIDNSVERIQCQVGTDKVILGFSGGIDSTVTATLLHRAIGNNLTCIFIDNGLLRINEAQHIINMFKDQFNLNVIYAEERFLTALRGKSDPEIKRKIIKHLFLEILEEEALKLKNVKWLAQGTIYPDVIESSSLINYKTKIIKSHHNILGNLSKNMKLKLIEPLRELFKDEVRKIGLELGLSYDILNRHPFPGPGLGIRILGEVKKEYCDLLRHVDSIFIEELQKANLYDKVSQAFAVFLPIRSVGIMGDNRKYDWIISLRAIKTLDFMTANWVHLPYDFLGHVSKRITNEVNGISRVVYDISNKPPATIEWE